MECNYLQPRCSDCFRRRLSGSTSAPFTIIGGRHHNGKAVKSPAGTPLNQRLEQLGFADKPAQSQEKHACRFTIQSICRAQRDSGRAKTGQSIQCSNEQSVAATAAQARDAWQQLQLWRNSPKNIPTATRHYRNSPKSFPTATKHYHRCLRKIGPAAVCRKMIHPSIHMMR